MKNIKKGFTLVELVVVIVILGILSTIGFVAYVDYLRGARDSNRIQQMTGIFDALQLFSTRSQLPLSRDSVQLRYGSNLIGYQGNIDLSVLERIEYSEGGKDPKTQDFFSYMVSPDRKSAQLLSYFEDERSVKSQIRKLSIGNTYKSYAAFEEDINFAELFDTDYTLLYPFVYGFELGILIEDESKAPVNKNIFLQNTTLDLFTSTGSYNSLISNTEVLEGSGDAFLGIIPRTDCKKIQKLLGGIPSGVYKINPSGVKPINTYCEMNLDSGGWTLVGRSHISSNNDFGWLSEYGNVFSNNDSYSMGDDTKDIRFNEVLFTTYTNAKNIDSAIKLTVDNYFTINASAADTSSTSNITNCEMILTGSLVNPCLDTNTGNQPAFTQWGKFSLTDTFWTGFDNTSSGALTRNGYEGGVSLGSGVGDSFDGKQGMIFVR